MSDSYQKQKDRENQGFCENLTEQHTAGEARMQMLKEERMARKKRVQEGLRGVRWGLGGAAAGALVGAHKGKGRILGRTRGAISGAVTGGLIGITADHIAHHAASAVKHGAQGAGQVHKIYDKARGK